MQPSDQIGIGSADFLKRLHFPQLSNYFKRRKNVVDGFVVEGYLDNGDNPMHLDVPMIKFYLDKFEANDEAI